MRALLFVTILLVATLSPLDAVTTVAVTDPNWFFTPLNWLQYTDAGVTYAQTANPGAYFKVGFTGTSAVLELEQTGAPTSPYMVLRWTIDDLPYKEQQLPLSSTSRSVSRARPHRRASRHDFLAETSTVHLTLAANLTAGEHTVFVLVRASSQGQDRWQGPACRLRIASLQLDDGAQTVPMALQPRRMLVYWDSIGEGVCTMGNGHGDLTDNDVGVTWDFSLANAMHAELSLVAFGGQGWTVTGGGGSVPIMNLDDPSKSAWSHYDLTHSRLSANGLLLPQPDFIFNGHATNDAFHSIPGANVTRAALAWLAQVRAAAPTAHVFLTIPFGGFHRDALTAAMSAYEQQTGGADWRTHLLDLGAEAALGISTTDSWKPTALAVDGVHPWYFRSAQLGGMMAVEANRLLISGVHA